MYRMSRIIEQTESFVTDLLTNLLDKNFLYHNLTHTQRVVKSTKEIINSLNLDSEDTETLILAAWLHDTGYIQGSNDHEESSCAIAKDFLEKQDYKQELSAKISQIQNRQKEQLLTEERQKLDRLKLEADEQNLRLLDFRIVEMGPEDLAAQFRAGRIPVIVNYEPWVTQAQRKTGAKVLASYLKPRLKRLYFQAPQPAW